MKKFKYFFIFLCSLLTVVSFVTPMTLNGLVFTQKDNSFLLYLVFVIFLFLYYKKYLYSLKYNKIFNFGEVIDMFDEKTNDKNTLISSETNTVLDDTTMSDDFNFIISSDTILSNELNSDVVYIEKDNRCLLISP